MQCLCSTPGSAGDLKINIVLGFRKKIPQTQKTESGRIVLKLLKALMDADKQKVNVILQFPVHLEFLLDPVVQGSNPCRCRFTRTCALGFQTGQSCINIAVVI